MNRIVIFLFIIGFIFSSDYTYGQSEIMDKVSSEISRTQLKSKIRKRGKDFYANIRKQLIDRDSLNFLSLCDTAFFLETYEYETGISYGMIWNEQKSIAYEYLKNKFDFENPPAFNKETIGLVKKWDVATIRKYETEKSNLTSPFMIFASRAIIKNGKVISVDCIEFEEFYLR
ncbi:hypothetical protein [Sphingobacterium sp. LRF_L2]|uniref:hypothetical protein n=1 Tax=Sphingobacterium sp. LRF_L2 TaxID=3369421 RepID=UPI003F6318B0